MPTTKPKNKDSRQSSQMTTAKRTRQKMATPAASADTPFNILINENGLLFNRLKLVAEQVHHQGEMSGGLRALLRMLDATGAQTVPQISRARAVSRQHVQALINELVDEGYLEFTENPAHKRSPFVQLTSQGQQAVAAMNRREERLHLKMPSSASDAELVTAARTMRKVRAIFEIEQWRRFAKTGKLRRRNPV